MRSTRSWTTHSGQHRDAQQDKSQFPAKTGEPNFPNDFGQRMEVNFVSVAVRWSGYMRGHKVDRCASLAPRRPTALGATIFMVMDVRRRTVRHHQCARGSERGRADLPDARPPGDRLEVDRAASADRLDALSSRGPTALVYLLRMHQRTMLRAAGGRPVSRRRIFRVSSVPPIGLRLPARAPEVSQRPPITENQDAARRQPE